MTGQISALGAVDLSAQAHGCNVGGVTSLPRGLSFLVGEEYKTTMSFQCTRDLYQVLILSQHLVEFYTSIDAKQTRILFLSIIFRSSSRAVLFLTRQFYRCCFLHLSLLLNIAIYFIGYLLQHGELTTVSCNGKTPSK